MTASSPGKELLDGRPGLRAVGGHPDVTDGRKWGGLLDCGDDVLLGHRQAGVRCFGQAVRWVDIEAVELRRRRRAGPCGRLRGAGGRDCRGPEARGTGVACQAGAADPNWACALSRGLARRACKGARKGPTRCHERHDQGAPESSTAALPRWPGFTRCDSSPALCRWGRPPSRGHFAGAPSFLCGYIKLISLKMGSVKSDKTLDLCLSAVVIEPA